MVDQKYLEALMNLYFFLLGAFGFYMLIRELPYIRKELTYLRKEAKKKREKEDEDKWKHS